MTEVSISQAKLVPEDIMTDFINNSGCAVYHSALMPSNLARVKPSEGILPRKEPYGTMCAMDHVNKPFLDIAQRLNWHRNMLGLDQKPYAEKAGLKRSQLSNWEAGNTRLSLDGALALRRTYGLSLDFMYEGIADTLPMALRSAWMESPEVTASR